MYEKNKNKNKKQSKIYEQEPLALFSLREEIGQNSNQWDSACLRPRAHRSPECHGRRTESPHRPQVKGSLLRDRAAGTSVTQRSSGNGNSCRCTFSPLGTFETTSICQSTHNPRSRMVTTIKKKKNPRSKAPNNLNVARLDADDPVHVY